MLLHRLGVLPAVIGRFFFVPSRDDNRLAEVSLHIPFRAMNMAVHDAEDRAKNFSFRAVTQQSASAPASTPNATSSVYLLHLFSPTAIETNNMENDATRLSHSARSSRHKTGDAKCLRLRLASAITNNIPLEQLK